MSDENLREEENRIEEAEGGKRRRKLAPDALRKWIRFFSVASVLLIVLLVTAVMMAFNHYNTYPGKVERDSISSPGRGADYIVLSWDEPHSTDFYKVWYREADPAEDAAKAEDPAEDGAQTEETAEEGTQTESAADESGQEEAGGGIRLLRA